MNALERHRQLTHRLLLSLAWLHVAVIFVAGWSVGAPVGWLAGAALIAAALATGVRAWGANATAVRATIAMALMAQISLLVATLKGNAWQVDMHMYYFAVLALVGFYCDAFAVIAAAGLVAVHHLGLNFLLPAALYAGGGDIGRVLMHAVVVVVESAGLIVMGEVIRKAFIGSEAALATAAEAQSRAETATREAESLRASERVGASDREADQRGALAEQVAMADAIGAELARVADGDLTARVEADLTGAYARLKTDLNKALARLETALGDVRQGAQGVRSKLSAIDEIAADISGGADAQVQQLGKVSASVQRMVGLVDRSSAGASRARAVVTAADEDANNSAVVVGRAIDAMSAITDSSTKIGAIIGVIDEIAFQTNLLALNAGVEAARAGEAGRGFAVVASEVRALAQRSAQAAKEIKELVSTSVAAVRNGADLVRQTGETLQRIVGRVSEINGVVADIAASAAEQSHSMAEIDSAVREIEQSTEDAAAMSQRAKTATSALAGDNDELERLIRQFRLNEDATRRRNSAAMRPMSTAA
jgi:methyl-accepting chemotaxis protein